MFVDSEIAEIWPVTTYVDWACVGFTVRDKRWVCFPTIGFYFNKYISVGKCVVF